MLDFYHGALKNKPIHHANGPKWAKTWRVKIKGNQNMLERLTESNYAARSRFNITFLCENMGIYSQGSLA